MTSFPSLSFRAAIVGLSLSLLPALAGAGDLGANGATLYASHCASCHQSLSRTTLNDRPAKRIRSAISTFPSMAPLHTLSEAEVTAIAEALATKPAAVTLR